MSLTMGTGPFAPDSPGTFNYAARPERGHLLYWEDCPKRVRAIFAGETVADSRHVKILHETALLPVYYFPEEDLRQDLLEDTDHTTHCPFKGDASYRSVRAGDEVAENAVWSYANPEGYFAPLKGYAAFYREKMDKWLEEDEEVIGHPHDPYHRVDVLQSSRHVKVTANGETIADTTRPLILFETGLPPRHYIPPEDVRDELLVPSGTQTICPYKGVASYRSLNAGGEQIEDAAWFYPEPLPEAQRVRGYLCFYDKKVEIHLED